MQLANTVAHLQVIIEVGQKIDKNRGALALSPYSQMRINIVLVNKCSLGEQKRPLLKT